MSDITFFKFPEYICPLHGDVKTWNFSLRLGDDQFDYCIVCLKELLDKHCCKLTKKETRE
jgi:hypothetical protein